MPSQSRDFRFDFPRLRIGIAEYEDGPTGCTVFEFPGGLPFAADVRGGSPGTVMADAGFANAICFAGGSLLGLEAAAGVAAELHSRRGHPETNWNDIPVVPGAILFDWGGRQNGIYPDKALGAAALSAAQPGVFPMGRRGAGRSATAGKAADWAMSEPAGQGAGVRMGGPVTVLVFTVVNALGAIVDRAGTVVRGNRSPDGERLSYLEVVERSLAAAPAPGQNTTLTLVVTNQRLAGRQLQQFARQVHVSMARAIQPFHTEFDGDVLFAVSTSEVDHPPLGVTSALGALASEAAWDAVLACFDPE